LLGFVADLKGSGTYNASVVTLCLEQELIGPALPLGLQLMAQEVTPPGTHPLIFMFGRQKDVRLKDFRYFALDFLEVALLIPYVRRHHKKGHYHGPFLFLPRLYFADTLPLLLARGYGMGQQRARLSMSQSDYAVHDFFSHKPLLTAHFKPRQALPPLLQNPLFEVSLAQLFKQPLIGSTIPYFFVSAFLQNDFSQAQFQPIAAEVHIQPGVLPGLRPGHYQVPGYDQSFLGALRLEVQWNLNLPRPRLG
jgi:hypothetical protein